MTVKEVIKQGFKPGDKFKIISTEVDLPEVIGKIVRVSNEFDKFGKGTILMDFVELMSDPWDGGIILESEDVVSWVNCAKSKGIA